MQYTVDSVDWSNPGSKISDHFTVHEALWLPSWRVYHVPTAIEKENILKMAQAMERVRAIFKRPVIVSCWIRPLKVSCPGSKWDGENYNLFIGSTHEGSGHVTAEAVDYHVSGFSGPVGCNTIRQTILPFLEEIGIRMEDIDGPWIHNDILPVKYRRFFKP